ncbi:MAG: polymer-forming cytoskeletal protein, partial [Phaeodactylibacter sp.]|nr:polymer-forming cytoskeletal protein [Phaeodactylibacter sp.]
MFGNNSKSKESGKIGGTNSGTSSHSLNSLVQGTVVEGDIQCKSDIRIDGTIKGSLNCAAKVIIGPTGAIEGSVTCKNAVIEGRFEGDLTVSERLDIKERANVNGEIEYGKLVVQPGAVLVGDVRMTGTEISPKAKNSNNV